MKDTRKHREVHKHKRAIITVCILGILVLCGLAGWQFAQWQWGVWCEGLPSVENADEYANAQKTHVYANDGTTLLATFYLEDRTPVGLDAISESVKKATIDTEDVRFYEHDGVDIIGIIRAFFNNLTGGELEGASTITQQYARNTILADEAEDITLRRKAREAQLALDLEKKYSKEEILNLYLNTINYGDGCYGIESAANHYYSKQAKDLTLNEAATLVGIPQSPSNLSPTVDLEACTARRNVVLQRMLEAEDIDQATFDATTAEPIALTVAPAAPADGIYAYPYFTSYVRDLLLTDYSESEVFKGGLTVYTTLDPVLQEQAQAACQEQYERMDDYMDASLTCIDPSTGYVLALVGGKDFYTDQYNLATQAQRQAGSSFKTFTLVSAIEQGISPSSYIDCSSPVTLNGWRVENYGNSQYGTRSIASALAVSSNTGFARLVQGVGPENVKATAEKMGITSPLEAVPSITLGSQGVNTLEMADAYATLAAGGVHRDATSITKILNSKGEVMFEHADAPKQVLTPEVAGAATKALQGVFTGGTATAARLYSGQVAAGKTGTSEEWRDHWLCGYTPQLSCAVWIGSREETTNSSIDCCNLWRTFMTSALEGSEIESFPVTQDPPYPTKINTNGTLANSTTASSSFSSATSSSLSSSSSSSSSSSVSDEQAAETESVPPSTNGQTLEEAAQTLAGYEAEYVEEYNATIPAGCVIRQEIVNGVVRLHVSLGPNTSGYYNYDYNYSSGN